ncbi:DUF4038 domain-containing protein [candidate division WWE3 bacterium]|nr:DUF4038 domain-containing protein [candidate division WWE3 bacterium]
MDQIPHKSKTPVILISTSLAIISIIFLIATIITSDRPILSRWQNTTKSSAASQLPIKISTNGRFLATADNQPFFMQADTAWRIPRLTQSEVNTYLADRAAKGFNTILGPVVTADVADYANRQNNDPTNPNLQFFEHIDYIVNKAAEYNINVAIVVVWGDKSNLFSSTTDAKNYGKFLGQRYKNNNNVMWIIAGEHTISGTSSSILTIWNALAEGIEESTNNTQLITIHGNWRQPGQSSSEFFHSASWLDFNTIQSSQGGGYGNWNLVTTDYSKTPIKPTFDGEPTYEGHNGWDANGVRRHAYWNIFAGGFGIGYGADGVWDFNGWQNALNTTGSTQIKYLKKLMLSRPFFTRIPDQSIISSVVSDGNTHPQATRSSDGSYAMVYIPTAQTITINMTKISGTTVKTYWYNPRTGASTVIAEYPAGGTRQFTTPTEGPDWVLVLDDASKNFPAPGSENTQPTPTSVHQSADINRDGIVNIFDLGILTGYYGQSVTSASPTNHRNSDINTDNTVNVFDLSLLIAQYNL